MDRYFSKDTNFLVPSEIKLIGIVCVFISSKYEEIYPCGLHDIYVKVGHIKYPLRQLTVKEKEIINKLTF